MARIFKALFLAGVALGLLGVLAAAVALLHVGRDLPSIDSAQELELHQPLRVLARDGALIGEFGAERREPLAWDDVPQQLIDAFLAAEDDRFFSHPGVDYQGLIRAAWVLVTTGEKAQGGSTITMQLARNLFLSSEKSYTRKIREILLALKLEQQLPKSEILRLYLNKIYLGQRAYGVAAAARIYYGKTVDTLSLDEAAMIAGLPKAPSAYNPVANPRRAQLRRDYVLRRMRELGTISAQEAAAAQAVPVRDTLAPAPVTVDARYVAEMVRQELYERYGDAIYTSGVEVVTTIDAQLQQAATAAVVDGVLDYDARHAWRGALKQVPLSYPVAEVLGFNETDRGALAEALLEGVEDVGRLAAAVVMRSAEEGITLLRRDGGLTTLDPAKQPWKEASQLPAGAVVFLRPLAVDQDNDAEVSAPWGLAQLPQAQAALVAIDPRDGSVRALVGGFDFFRSKFNRAAQARRQPGSSFKPFLYAAALDNGLTAATVLNDAPVVFDDTALGGAWRPENYDGRFRGPTRLREALVRSSNLVSIRILESVGVGRFREYTTRFGLDARNLPRDLSISLGSGTYTPMEIAAAYGVIANGGWMVRPRVMDSVRTAQGDEIERIVPLRVCAECPSEGELAQQSADSFAADGLEQDLEAAAPEPAFEVAPRVVDAATMYIVGDMMRDVIRRGTGAKARALGRQDIAGKTGTTNEQRDAWFAGFHPELVAVTWIGFDDLTPLGRGETGGKAALPIWMDFMAEALPGLPVVEALPPEGVVTARIDPDTGELSSTGIFELFLAGQGPQAAAVSPGADLQPTNDSEPAPSQEVLEDLF